jgi:hypothetical protein
MIEVKNNRQVTIPTTDDWAVLQFECSLENCPDSENAMRAKTKIQAKSISKKIPNSRNSFTFEVDGILMLLFCPMMSPVVGRSRGSSV